MKTAKRICLDNHTIEIGDGVVFTLNAGQEYLTSIEKDGEITVVAGYWIHEIPVTWFGAAREGPGESWDRPVDIETALRVYKEYAKEVHGRMVSSTFTAWCTRQLATDNRSGD